MQFWLKMDKGPVEVTGNQIEQLRKQGRLPDDKRLISVDGGETYYAYPSVLEYFETEPKPKVKKVYSKCANCNATLEGTSDKVGKTDTCPSCGNSYVILEEDRRSKATLLLTVVAVVLGLGDRGLVCVRRRGKRRYRPSGKGRSGRAGFIRQRRRRRFGIPNGAETPGAAKKARSEKTGDKQDRKASADV